MESLYKPLLVGIAGRKGSGKSTLAKGLCKAIGAHIYSFARPIKDAAHHWWGIPWHVLNGTDEIKNSATVEVTVGEKPTLLSVRKLLQRLGTEVGRQIDENVWINYTLNQFPLMNPMLIDDVRFANECRAIQAKGGVVLGLRRGQDTGDPHASESDIPNLPVDLWISDGDAEATLAVALAFLKDKEMT